MSVTTSSILHRTPWTPPVAVHGDGIYVELEDGRRVIDGIGGAAVSCLGISHPKVIAAMKDQLDTLAYVHNMKMSSRPAEELAKFLVDSSNGAFELVVFLSGGSEAMEAAMKLARQYFVEIGQPRRRNFIARQMSFHGNTLGTLSLGYHPTRRVPYADILDDNHFYHISPAYAKRFQKPGETEEEYVGRLRQELEDKFIELGPDTVIGFAAETVVGATTGVLGAPKGYFAAMKSVCEKHGALFILDEIMCGMGRMGSLHAWQSVGDGAAPDLQAIAKGLGGGYASIGAVLLSPKVANGIRSGSGILKHGHTYQAHPLACAASLAIQRMIKEEGLLTKVIENGELMHKLLWRELLSEDAMAAVYCREADGYDFGSKTFALLVQTRCLKNGLIVMGMNGGASLDGSRGDHIVLSPAFNATTREIETIVEIFVRSVDEVLRDSLL